MVYQLINSKELIDLENAAFVTAYEGMDLKESSTSAKNTRLKSLMQNITDWRLQYSGILVTKSSTD